MRDALVLGLLAGCSPPGAAAPEPGTEGTTVAASSSSSSSSDGASTGARFDQTLACESWLACLDDGEREELLPEYGPDGSCWRGSASLVEDCDAACVDGYHEDCSDPSRPDLPPGVEECSLEALAPTAASWVIAGERAGTLPAEIGAIIERNCSCHATEPSALPPDTPIYEGALRFVTHADFHAAFEATTTHVEVFVRVYEMKSMPPLYFCGDGDFGSSIESPDYEVFEAWLLAEAPDAPTWAEIRPDDLP